MGRITIRLAEPETKYSLEYPAFFVEVTKGTLKKIMAWCCFYDYLNRETLEFFDRELPNLEEDIRQQDAKSIEQLKKNWEYENSAGKRSLQARKAKAEYDNALKKAPKHIQRAKDALQIWLDAKANFQISV